MLDRRAVRHLRRRVAPSMQPSVSCHERRGWLVENVIVRGEPLAFLRWLPNTVTRLLSEVGTPHSRRAIARRESRSEQTAVAGFSPPDAVCSTA